MENKTLLSVSRLIAYDTYKLYVYKPDNYKMKKFGCRDAKIINDEKQSKMRIITLQTDQSKNVN